MIAIGLYRFLSDVAYSFRSVEMGHMRLIHGDVPSYILIITSYFTLILGIVTVGGLAFALKLMVNFCFIKLSTNFIRGNVDFIGNTKSALSASIIIITSLPKAGSPVNSEKK